MRHFILFLTLCFLLPQFASAEKGQPFFDSKTINLTQLLPAPPANNSEQTKTELAEVLLIQASRTPSLVEQARADAVEEVWRFADVIKNSKFTKQNLPKFAAFFERIVATEGAVTDSAKATWKRPRPHMVSPLVKPVVKLSSSGSWPSGHATVGTMMGIILSNMLPDKRGEIMARAWEFSNNRLVAGIHFRSDVEMGRISGTTIVAILMTRKDFQMEFVTAKKELHNVLGI